MKGARIVNLDLFRAIAILFVIFFHTTQMYAGENINPYFYTWGKFGVEFFFVLSGFLVGGLFYKQTVKVNLLRFWMLRFFRTYPPYIIALLLSYLAVFHTRNAHFNIGYLFFIQNFYTTIPYFKVSWSLCIEEHFYLAFPLIILISEKILKRPAYQLSFWILLCLLPALLRWSFGNHLAGSFGYYQTASYFRFEGICMGCLGAFLIYRKKLKIQFSIFLKFSILIFFILMTFINVYFQFSLITYCLGYLLFNISLLLLLSVFYFSKNFKLSANPVVASIASMAYSLYLTHALTINFFGLLANKFKMGIYVNYIITIAGIFFIGFIFYKLIEQPTIKYRNLYFQSKGLRKYKIFNSLNWNRKPAL